jgi:hypothetical protein
VSHNIGDNVAEKRKPAVGSGISCVGIGVGSASQGNLLAKRQLIKLQATSNKPKNKA